jgi:polyphosphate kinase
LIDRETRNAKRGRPARITAKMNALVDPPVIQALYRASQAGVEIDLIVRGQCALVPGLRGVSSHIRVRSIVGRFLEHSRIFYFENAGNAEIYLGSADWMQRNLYERVEVLFPLKDPDLRRRITELILPVYLTDTRTARLLGPDGKYSRTRAGRNGHGLSVQEQLMRASQQPASGFDTRGRAAKSNRAAAVYTASAGSAALDDSTAESVSQDSLNASV